MNALETLRLRAQEAEAWFDARTERERMQLAVAAGAALLALWLVLLHQPVSRASADARAVVETVAGETERLEGEVGTLAASADDAPARQRDEIARLEREVQALAERATAAGSSVLPPREVVALLRALLAGQPELRLVRIESLAPEPVAAPGVETGATPPRLFRHAIEIEVEGAYLPTLAWLRAMAALPWRLHWDALRYDVVEHPRARIVLRLHTLGREPEWIRA